MNQKNNIYNGLVFSFKVFIITGNLKLLYFNYFFILLSKQISNKTQKTDLAWLFSDIESIVNKSNFVKIENKASENLKHLVKLNSFKSNWWQMNPSTLFPTKNDVRNAHEACYEIIQANLLWMKTQKPTLLLIVYVEGDELEIL